MVESLLHKVEQIVIPVVCFFVMVCINVRYLRTYVAPRAWVESGNVQMEKVTNLRTFFEGIRTSFVMQHHKKGNSAGQVAVQTMRDFISVTTGIASAAMLFISIFIGLSKSGILSLDVIGCLPGSQSPASDRARCKSMEARLAFVRFVSVMVNFVAVFFNMLLSTRYAINTSFMINTKAIDGVPLDPLITANVISRAGFHFSLGIRGFFFSAPLVAWLFGSWPLLAATILYCIAVLLMEEDFLNMDEIWADEGGGPSDGAAQKAN